jgi:hyperosmotically inducible protein
MRTIRFVALPTLAVLLTGASLTALVPVARASAAIGMQSSAGSNDAQIQADLTKSLNKSKWKGVQVAVQNGVVDLTGSVNVYQDKEDADKKAHHTKNVTAVRNEIQVAGPEISDQELQQKIVKGLEYDRVGYGTTAFNAISVNVQNGVVTLGGHAYGPVDAESAVGLVSNLAGVKDVVDEIQVDPVSPMDDRIRVTVARAVYGFPTLQKYAIDPGKPIRISVQNGNVTLYGVVDNQADKDAAGIRANSVPGVFKVTNDLQVVNQPSEKK